MVYLGLVLLMRRALRLFLVGGLQDFEDISSFLGIGGLEQFMQVLDLNGVYGACLRAGYNRFLFSTLGTVVLLLC
jgi:hypothetical protein